MKSNTHQAIDQDGELKKWIGQTTEVPNFN
jgi:hypothetical protein